MRRELLRLYLVTDRGLSMGRDMVDIVREAVATWLNTEFEGGRHIRRVEKISEIEEG